MKRVDPSDDWPVSWKESFRYDRQEVYGERVHLGYAYAYECRRRTALDLVERYVPRGGAVLDVAAAQGNYTIALAEKGYEVTWNDIRAELQGYVEMKRERGVVRYAPGNCLDLSFPKPFDGVLITEIIEHVAHPDEFLKAMAGLVKEGGHIIMTTPNGGYFRNRLPRFSDFDDPSVFEERQFGPNVGDHIFLLHPDEVFGLAEQAGLEVIDLRLGTNFLTNGHVKTAPLLRLLPRGIVFFLEGLTSRLPLLLRERIVTSLAAVLRRRP